jgi:hypothetical protein
MWWDAENGAFGLWVDRFIAPIIEVLWDVPATRLHLRDRSTRVAAKVHSTE